MDKKYKSFTIVDKIKLIKEFKESKVSQTKFAKSKVIPRSTLGLYNLKNILLCSTLLRRRRGKRKNI